MVYVTSGTVTDFSATAEADLAAATGCVTSTFNSSTSVLTASSTFTGTAELDVRPDVLVSVKTDQKGTLYTDFSPDGTNWDSTLSFAYDPAKINPPHVLVKGSRYFRVRFTNTGTSTQTYLRLRSSYGHYQKLTAAINGTLSQGYDAIVTRPTDYFEEVSAGKRQGVAQFSKFGYNADVGTTDETIWSYSTGTFTPLTTARTMSIVSASADDASAGTGARTVLISGVGSTRETLEETVTLNGTTPVVTSGTFFGINRMTVATAGSGKVNAGAITATATTAGTVQAYIDVGVSLTQQMIFHVPSTAKCYIHRVKISTSKLSGGGAPRVTVYMIYESGGVKYTMETLLMDTSVENVYDHKYDFPIVLPAGSVWYMNVVSSSTGPFVRARVEQAIVDT